MARTVREVADGIFVLNYPYLNQNIGLIVGRDAAAVIDTRSSTGQAREIVDDVRAITALPVTIAIDTHGHSDHAFGNHVFQPATIWGQAGCPAYLAATEDHQRRETAKDLPDEADDIRSMAIVPPDRLVESRATIEVGGRAVELLYLGRGHTDHDLVVHVADAPGVVFAGDLVTRSEFPFFGDAFPLDFPATVAEIGALAWEVLVTGHGGLGDRAYLAQHEERLRALVEVARDARDTHTPIADVVSRVPMAKSSATDGLRRAIAQLDGAI